MDNGWKELGASWLSAITRISRSRRVELNHSIVNMLLISPLLTIPAFVAQGFRHLCYFHYESQMLRILLKCHFLHEAFLPAGVRVLLPSATSCPYKYRPAVRSLFPMGLLLRSIHSLCEPPHHVYKRTNRNSATPHNSLKVMRLRRGTPGFCAPGACSFLHTNGSQSGVPGAEASLSTGEFVRNRSSQVPPETC